MSDKDDNIDEATGVETTGHSWDGIEELNNPLPRWWLWTFYATIVWGVGYTIAYPAWPMISGATAGVMGWSTRANVAEEIQVHEARNDGLVSDLLEVELASLQCGRRPAPLCRFARWRGVPRAVQPMSRLGCRGGRRLPEPAG